MTKRPNISVKMKVDAALRQAFGCAHCPLCKKQLLPEHERILEHMVPYAWDHSNITENLAWVHKECAHQKTYGSKATSAGGDIHKIAKAKRLAKAREVHEAILRGEPRHPGSIKSRGFDKTYRKRMNGEVVRRTT